MYWKKLTNYIMQRKIKQIIFYVVVGIVFWLGILSIAKIKIFDMILPYATFLENCDEEQFIRNFTSEMTIEQEFVSPHDFECVTLSCSDHEKDLAGKTVIELWRGDDTLAALEEIENHSISYGIPVEIHLDEIGIKNEVYKLKITACDTDEESIGFFGYIPAVGEKTAIVNNTPSEYALSVGTHIHTNLFWNLFWTILSILFIGMCIVIWMLSKKNIQPEKVFLLIAIPAGIVLLCFLSVNIINDGDAHFARAYHYANVFLGTASEDGDDVITMREDDIDTLYNSNCQDARNAQNMWHIYDNWKWFAEDTNLVNGIEWRSAGITNIVVYFPSIIAIVIARIINLGTYPMIYLARIFPFICYLIGVYYAIKMTPVGKHLMMFLAALPIALQQATGITYDNVTVIFLFLVTACFLKVYFDGMSIHRGIMLAILCVLLGCCKGGIYTPMLFLLFFLGKDKFGSFKRKLLYIFGVGILTMCITLLNYGPTIRAYMQSDRQNVVQRLVEVEENEGTDSGANGTLETDAAPQSYGVSYAFKEPWRFIKLIINSLMEQMEFYINSLLGRNVAWSVQELPLWSYLLFGVALVCVKNGIGEENYRIDNNIRIGMICTFVIILLAFFALFLIDTPDNYSYIWGIQGRYFLPQLVLLLLGLRNNNVRQDENSEKVLIVTYYMQMVLFMMGYFLIFMTQTYNY